MGNIYFIRSNDRIKIGYSDNIVQRKVSLQTGNANRLVIEYVIKDASMIFEKHIHSVCKQFLILNEWFEEGVLDHLLKQPWYKENMISDFTE